MLQCFWGNSQVYLECIEGRILGKRGTQRINIVSQQYLSFQEITMTVSRLLSLSVLYYCILLYDSLLARKAAQIKASCFSTTYGSGQILSDLFVLFKCWQSENIYIYIYLNYYYYFYSIYSWINIKALNDALWFHRKIILSTSQAHTSSNFRHVEKKFHIMYKYHT